MNTHDDIHENPAIADILARQAADRRVTLSRRECQLEGGWAQSSQILKENQGLLRHFVDGSRVRVTSQSFYEHLLALARAAPKKVRMPATRFARRRDPTPAELDGLKRGNDRRAREARKRRESKAAAAAPAE
jgi:hypothetical protein